MLLSLQNGFSFRIAGLKPPPETAPRYLKLVTVPGFCPFILISLWMPLTLFVIRFTLSAPISILNLVQFLSRLSTRSSNSCSSSARAPIPSAKRSLVIFLPPILTFSSCSSRPSGMIRSRNMLKRVLDRVDIFLAFFSFLYNLPVWEKSILLTYSVLYGILLRSNWVNVIRPWLPILLCKYERNIIILIILIIGNRKFVPFLFWDNRCFKTMNRQHETSSWFLLKNIGLLTIVLKKLFSWLNNIVRNILMRLR